MEKDLTKLFAILFVVGIFIGSQVFGAVVTERRINKRDACAHNSG